MSTTDASNIIAEVNRKQIDESKFDSTVDGQSQIPPVESTAQVPSVRITLGNRIRALILLILNVSLLPLLYLTLIVVAAWRNSVGFLVPVLLIYAFTSWVRHNSLVARILKAFSTVDDTFVIQQKLLEAQSQSLHAVHDLAQYVAHDVSVLKGEPQLQFPRNVN